MLNAADYITYKNMAADNAGVDRLPAFSTQENIDAVLNFVNKNSEVQEVDAECCGQHEVCEKESLLAAVSKKIEYYDDEELDK